MVREDVQAHRGPLRKAGSQLPAKFLFIVGPERPRGVTAYLCALLGVSMERDVQEHIGPDLEDASGDLHPGLFDRVISYWPTV